MKWFRVGARLGAERWSQDFAVAAGEQCVKAYEDTKTETGTPIQRNFCVNCGSQLWATNPINDGIISVFAGTMDNFDEWRPDREQYCISRAEWLPAFEGLQEKHVSGPLWKNDGQLTLAG